MDRRDHIDQGAVEQAGIDVQAMLDTPGWSVIQAELDSYVDLHTRAMLGKASENDRMVQYQLGRIAAVKMDLPGLIENIVDRGRAASRSRSEEESDG